MAIPIAIQRPMVVVLAGRGCGEVPVAVECEARMKYLCGHAHDAEGGSDGTIKEPCPGCAIRDWKAMQALREGKIATVQSRWSVSDGRDFLVSNTRNILRSVDADPADAILACVEKMEANP